MCTTICIFAGLWLLYKIYQNTKKDETEEEEDE